MTPPMTIDTLDQMVANQVAVSMERTQETIDSTDHYIELVEALQRKLRVVGPFVETEDVALSGLLNCARVMSKHLKQLGAALKDPTTVHTAMIRGLIAKPSWRTMVDLHGEVPNGEDAQLMRIAELQEQLAVADARVEKLEHLAGTCYAGLVAECDLPEPWAEALLLASSGEDFSEDGLLPFAPERQEVMWEIQTLTSAPGAAPSDWSPWSSVSRDIYEKALLDRNHEGHTTLRARVTYGHAQVITHLMKPPSVTAGFSQAHTVQTQHPLHPYQIRTLDWMRACFTQSVIRDRTERADRFLEESLELVRTFKGYDAERAHKLVDYTFNRPVGECNQEVGGVMVTLAALCNAVGVSMVQEGERELARVWTKIDVIREKQAAKADIFGPLP